MYWVYVLRSETTGRKYVGQTNDLHDRLKRHNGGFVRSTRPFRPWVIIHQEEYSTRAKAMQREKFLKCGVGREFIRSLKG